MIDFEVIGHLPVSGRCSKKYGRGAKKFLGGSGNSIVADAAFWHRPTPFCALNVRATFRDIVFCHAALAHTDDGWKTEIFVSLVLHGQYAISTTRGRETRYHRVRPGDVFVLDPLMLHSAAPETVGDVLVLDQFIISRRGARKQIEDVRRMIAGAKK